MRLKTYIEGNLLNSARFSNMKKTSIYKTTDDYNSDNIDLPIIVIRTFN